jgi:hypothetical protein
MLLMGFLLRNEVAIHVEYGCVALGAASAVGAHVSNARTTASRCILNGGKNLSGGTAGRSKNPELTNESVGGSSH